MPDNPRILVALTPAVAAEEKLSAAAAQARAAGAEVVLLHVPVEDARSGSAPPSEAASAEAYLNAAADRLRAGGLSVVPVVRPGRRPGQVVLETARELDASLIVIGSGSSGGGARLQRLFSRRVYDEITRGASCPVLVVGPPPPRAR